MELTKAMLGESINLKKGGMIVKEYALKITLLSKHASSFVANPRDLINRFMSRVSDLV